MQLIDNLKQKILDSSDSYNYYKNVSYEKAIQNEKKIRELEKTIKSMKRENDAVSTSYNELFNLIFLDYELKPKGVLSDIHALCLELLNFIDNVCQKHGIEYWLDYGTLLGGVRHGGYIPWDDDIDLGMMRKDFEKFLEVIEDEVRQNGLDSFITVRRYRVTERYYVLFIQVIYRQVNSGDILAGLDIFPYDFIKSFDDETPEKFMESKIEFKRKLKEGIALDVAVRQYFDEMDISYEAQDHIIPAPENLRSSKNRYDFKIMPYEKIFPLSTVEFCENSYPCPNDYDYYLKSIYNDYMKIHKVIVQHDDRLLRLRKSNKYDEFFKEHIAKLRKINEEFI